MKKIETLNIVRYPNEILRKRALPIEKITKDVFKLSEEMTKLMLEHDGVGLAANQVGKLSRIFVLNTTPFEDKPNPITAINPEVVDVEGTTDEEEGCLCFPKLYLHIPRARKVRVSMRNLYNEKLIFEMEDFLAKAVLHEIDHLNGVLFIDLVKEDEREKVMAYLEEIKAAVAI